MLTGGACCWESQKGKKNPTGVAGIETETSGLEEDTPWSVSPEGRGDAFRESKEFRWHSTQIETLVQLVIIIPHSHSVPEHPGP